MKPVQIIETDTVFEAIDGGDWFALVLHPGALSLRVQCPSGSVQITIDKNTSKQLAMWLSDAVKDL